MIKRKKKKKKKKRKKKKTIIKIVSYTYQNLDLSSSVKRKCVIFFVWNVFIMIKFVLVELKLMRGNWWNLEQNKWFWSSQHFSHPLHAKPYQWRKLKKVSGLHPVWKFKINDNFIMQLGMFANLCTNQRKNLLLQVILKQVICDLW